VSGWHKLQGAIAREGKHFFTKLHDPGETQRRLLHQIVEQNRNSEFGRRFRFDAIESVAEYQAKVPLQCYEDLAPDVERMANAEQGILCKEAVIAFEKTGGSSAGSKLIPYTRRSMAAFQQALHPWLHDLLRHRPGIMHGSAYWSISPALRRTTTTAGGIPIGLESDAAYFGSNLAAEIGRLLAVPPAVGRQHDFQNWQYLTLRYLLAADDLSLISVWSPTFLLDLVAALKRHHERLADDIAYGRISIQLGEEGKRLHSAILQASPHRASEVLNACSGATVDCNRLWPRLDTLSCWLDSSAARYRAQLDDLFPGIYIQGKGLLATEGVVSLPVVNAKAPVLAINSGFYEFIDDRDHIHLADELEPGELYRVVMSNYSGLYRYELGDQVRMAGLLDATPLLEFVGRSGNVSDLCGEKLSEAFVQGQLSDVKGFALLLPCHAERIGYQLVLDESQYAEAEALQLAVQIDKRLASNPQYAYARKMGQLAPLMTLRVVSPWNRYLRYQCRRQRRLGDIKPVALSQDEGLLAEFMDHRETPASSCESRC
jgi:hypothetical protein